MQKSVAQRRVRVGVGLIIVKETPAAIQPVGLRQRFVDAGGKLIEGELSSRRILKRPGGVVRVGEVFQKEQGCLG